MIVVLINSDSKWNHQICQGRLLLKDTVTHHTPTHITFYLSRQFSISLSHTQPCIFLKQWHFLFDLPLRTGSDFSTYQTVMFLFLPLFTNQSHFGTIDMKATAFTAFNHLSVLFIILWHWEETFPHSKAFPGLLFDFNLHNLPCWRQPNRKRQGHWKRGCLWKYLC